MQKIKEQIRTFHDRYERYYPASFFVAGFLFDIVTLSRIDDTFTILQQIVYLVILGTILTLRSYEYAGQLHPIGFFKKIWNYNTEILHFIFGSLLSVYTLFFFLSSSLVTSFVFLIFMFVVLVINEFPLFQKQGPWLKFALFSLCLSSFFSFVIPVVIGFIGIIPLVAALSLSCFIIYLISKLLIKKGIPSKSVFQTTMGPAIGISIVFLGLYFFKLLPPIPVSIQYIGMYHKVEKLNGNYFLYYERPWLYFWQSGAQTFIAQPGDKPHCFVRIFSPTGFKDKVYFHWLKKNVYGNWDTQDRIPNTIVGGRDEGFRGYSVKSNFEPGEWRVQVETEDQREIGRIHFEIVSAEAAEREFRIDKF